MSNFTNILTKLSSAETFTYLLLATSLLGVHIIALNLGAFQLSPYRLLLIISPIVFFKMDVKAFNHLKASRNVLYFNFLSVWILYSFITLLWVQDVSGWGRIFMFLVSGTIVSWFLGWQLRSTSDIINSLRIVEIIAVLLALIGLYEIITGDYLILSEENLEYYRNRSVAVSTIGYRVPVSVFSNPNDFALFLFFVSFFSFSLSKVKSTVRGRLFSISCTGLFLFLLVATQSRSSFIGLTIAVFCYYILSVRRKYLPFFIIGTLLLALFLVPVISNYNELYQALFTIDVSGGGDASRINLIKNGLIFLENSYFFGIGLGNIEYYMERFGVFNTGSNTSIHNWWMEIMVSSGITIFFIYLFIYVRSMIWLFGGVQTSIIREYKVLSLCFFCTMAGFVIACMGSSSLMRNEWLWPLFAIIMAFLNLSSKNYK